MDRRARVTTPTSTWPDGYQSAAVVTVNFDGESFEQPMLPGEPLWGRYSYGRYGAQVGIERILDVLDRYRVRATFFIPGWDVERYPEVMRDIAAAGHELAGRGWANDDFAELTIDEQRAILERSEAAFECAFGQKPAGFRAPSGIIPLHEPRASLSIQGSHMSAATRPLLAERGYRYDSSFCDDDIPYLVETAGGARLVELPQHTTASDRHYYQHHRLPEVVAAAWREDLSAVHEAGGLFNLALSPRGDWGSGRGVRIRAVEAIVQAIHETPNVWTATCADIADWFLRADGSPTTYPA
jgi:peptidoglycan/xylan/chitin deacetylase (PgdA/CDA1 family)